MASIGRPPLAPGWRQAETAHRGCGLGLGQGEASSVYGADGVRHGRPAYLLGKVASVLSENWERIRPSGLLCGNLRRSWPFSRDLLSRGELQTARSHDGARQSFQQSQAEPPDQGNAGFAADAVFPRVTGSEMKTKASQRRMDVNLEELDRIIDGARHAPLGEADGQNSRPQAARSATA